MYGWLHEVGRGERLRDRVVHDSRDLGTYYERQILGTGCRGLQRGPGVRIPRHRGTIIGNESAGRSYGFAVARYNGSFSAQQRTRAGQRWLGKRMLNREHVDRANNARYDYKNALNHRVHGRICGWEVRDRRVWLLSAWWASTDFLDDISDNRNPVHGYHCAPFERRAGTSDPGILGSVVTCVLGLDRKGVPPGDRKRSQAAACPRVSRLHNGNPIKGIRKDGFHRFGVP